MCQNNWFLKILGLLDYLQFPHDRVLVKDTGGMHLLANDKMKPRQRRVGHKTQTCRSECTGVQLEMVHACDDFLHVLPRAPLHDTPDRPLSQVQQVVVGPEADQAHHRERHSLQAHNPRVGLASCAESASHHVIRAWCGTAQQRREVRDRCKRIRKVRCAKHMRLTRAMSRKEKTKKARESPSSWACSKRRRTSAQYSCR